MLKFVTYLIKNIMQNLVQEGNETIRARANMVQNQLVPNNITSQSVLDAISAIPKHLFVDAFRPVAYSESEIRLNNDRVILEPLVFAKMLQACAIRKGDMVLDIGCGLGYSSAVLAMLAKEVTAIENDTHFVTNAKYNLNNLNISNVNVLLNTLQYGYPNRAPYNVIFINGAFKNDVEILFEQLSNAGRLVIIESSVGGIAMATIYTKHQDQLDREYICHCNINYLE